MAEFPDSAVRLQRHAAPFTSSHELGVFLQRACHDLRAPVRAVRTHADLLVRKSGAPQSGALDTHLNFIVEGTRKLELLAEGLSNYSVALRIEESSFRSVPADLLVRTALAKLREELVANHAEVVYSDLPRVHCDPDRLSQVFENLVANTLRHRGDAPPRVHIAAEKESTRWRFTVRDNGPGVESEYLERIFQPFERLHAGQSAAPGLGLTISREIVEKHGGRLWAESELGAGSTFLFTIPPANL